MVAVLAIRPPNKALNLTLCCRARGLVESLSSCSAAPGSLAQTLAATNTRVPMLPENQTKTNIGVGIGVLLQLAGFYWPKLRTRLPSGQFSFL